MHPIVVRDRQNLSHLIEGARSSARREQEPGRARAIFEAANRAHAAGAAYRNAPAWLNYREGDRAYSAAVYTPFGAFMLALYHGARRQGCYLVAKTCGFDVRLNGRGQALLFDDLATLVEACNGQAS